MERKKFRNLLYSLVFRVFMCAPFFRREFVEFFD